MFGSQNLISFSFYVSVMAACDRNEIRSQWSVRWIQYVLEIFYNYLQQHQCTRRCGKLYIHYNVSRIAVVWKSKTVDATTQFTASHFIDDLVKYTILYFIFYQTTTIRTHFYRTHTANSTIFAAQHKQNIKRNKVLESNTK